MLGPFLGGVDTLYRCGLGHGGQCNYQREAAMDQDDDSKAARRVEPPAGVEDVNVVAERHVRRMEGLARMREKEAELTPMVRELLTITFLGGALWGAAQCKMLVARHFTAGGKPAGT